MARVFDRLLELRSERVVCESLNHRLVDYHVGLYAAFIVDCGAAAWRARLGQKPESASQTSGRIRDTFFRVAFLDIGVSDGVVIRGYKFPLCRIPICRSSFIRSRAPYIEPPLKSSVAQCILRQCFKGLRAVMRQHVEFVGYIRVTCE